MSSTIDRCFLCLDESASVSSYYCERECKNTLCGACALGADARCLICRGSSIVGLPDNPKRRALLTVASDAQSTLDWLSSHHDNLVWMFSLKCRLRTLTRYRGERNPSQAILNILSRMLMETAWQVSIFKSSYDDDERSIATVVTDRISGMVELLMSI